MSVQQRDFYTAYSVLSPTDLARITGDRNLNPFTQVKLLAATLAMPFKETGRAHYRSLIQNENGHRPYEQVQIADGLAWLERLGLERSLFDGFTVLPRYSFGVELRFELSRPYLSQDDDALYIIDNPVHKDKVFKVPFIAPTSWKGSLRAAATRGLLTAFVRLLPAESPTNDIERENLLAKLWLERARRVMIFGNESENEANYLNRWIVSRLYPVSPGEDKKRRLKYLEEKVKQLGETFYKYLRKNHYLAEKIEGRQGRLFCFPTFFNQIGLEVINPHDRERRVGKNPILFECVPTGAVGTFRLLYVSYDFPSEVTPDEVELRQQIQTDLQLIAETVHNLLTFYGFGAKTTSGFGIAKDALVETGKLMVEGKSYPFNKLSQLTAMAQQVASDIGEGGTQ
ncbi:MAG: RAMP superfamily CRISPR-associated protein [candidate division KSB1 bacterium]|nr:RAMP superfamily CRISPR-associated protein [candidate division KSB1 bacterium]